MILSTSVSMTPEDVAAAASEADRLFQRYLRDKLGIALPLPGCASVADLSAALVRRPGRSVP